MLLFSKVEMSKFRFEWVNPESNVSQTAALSVYFWDH